jgi:lipoprotein signal peptidase
MFIVYPLLLALLIGLLMGRSPASLGRIHFRWAWLAMGSLAVQLLIFSTPLGEVLGGLAPIGYIASTAAALLFVLANVQLPGLVMVAAGAASNLLAILANGGYMPTTAEALAAVGHKISTAYSNSTTAANVALAPLTDIFALPRQLPVANVFSIGDVLIGVGVFVLVLAAMRRPRAGVQERRATPPD